MGYGSKKKSLEVVEDEVPFADVVWVRFSEDVVNGIPLQLLVFAIEALDIHGLYIINLKIRAIDNILSIIIVSTNSTSR